MWILVYFRRTLSKDFSETVCAEPWPARCPFISLYLRPQKTKAPSEPFRLCFRKEKKINRKFGILCRSESQILAEPLSISLWNEVENDTNWTQLQKNTSPKPRLCRHQSDFPTPIYKTCLSLVKKRKDTKTPSSIWPRDIFLYNQGLGSANIHNIMPVLFRSDRCTMFPLQTGR